jgi:hypothetical protein
MTYTCQTYTSGEIESTPRLNEGAKDTMGRGEVLTASAED